MSEASCAESFIFCCVEKGDAELVMYFCQTKGKNLERDAQGKGSFLQIMEFMNIYIRVNAQNSGLRCVSERFGTKFRSETTKSHDRRQSVSIAGFSMQSGLLKVFATIPSKRQAKRCSFITS